MNTLNISIPNTIGYLSEWSTFDATLPNGKIIVNKIICGCGMTDYYLTNNIPVILASPRRELILSKTKNSKNIIMPITLIEAADLFRILWKLLIAM